MRLLSNPRQAAAHSSLPKAAKVDLTAFFTLVVGNLTAFFTHRPFLSLADKTHCQSVAKKVSWQQRLSLKTKKTYTGGVPHVSHYLSIWNCCIEIFQVINRRLFFVMHFLQGGWGHDKVSTAKVGFWKGQKMFGLGVSDFFISSTSKSWWVTSAPYHWTNCLATSTELLLWR